MSNLLPLNPTGLQAPALFKDRDSITPLLQSVRKEVMAFVPDVTTKEGRDEIASIAYKVARSKTALDDAGKASSQRRRSGSL